MLQNVILGKTSTLVDECLGNFFTSQLNCLYRTEKEFPLLLMTLRRMAPGEELKELIQQYLLQSEKQFLRLEEIFSILLIAPLTGQCSEIEVIKRDIHNLTQKNKNAKRAHDAALLVIQKAIHYKMTAYASLEQLAASLGMEDVCNLLNQCFQDEKEYELLFAELAEKNVVAESEWEP